MDKTSVYRDMWLNPIKYARPGVVGYATEEYGSPVNRNQLNHRYGNRYEKEQKNG
jgi:hypothetical protein